MGRSPICSGVSLSDHRQEKRDFNGQFSTEVRKGGQKDDPFSSRATLATVAAATALGGRTLSPYPSNSTLVEGGLTSVKQS